MAASSSLNRRYTEIPGSTGGLANRSTKHAGGVRSRFEHPIAFRDRMDAGRAGNTSAPMTGGVQPPMTKAPMPAGSPPVASPAMPGGVQPPTSPAGQSPVTPPPQFVSAPDGQGGNKMVRLPSPPASPAVQSAPPSGGTHTLSAPATAPQPGVTPPQVMGPNMGPPRPRRNLAAEAATRVTPAPPVTRDVTNNAPSRVTPPTPSRPGGMMAVAGQIAQGMQTAMTTTNPVAVPPRAAAINQTLQQRQPAPQGMPAGPLFTGNTAKAAIEYGKPYTAKGPQPISNAGLGVKPPTTFKPRAIIAAN